MIIRRSKISRKSRKVARKSRKVARKSRKVVRKSRKVVRKSKRSLKNSRKSRSIGGSDDPSSFVNQIENQPGEVGNIHKDNTTNWDEVENYLKDNLPKSFLMTKKGNEMIDDAYVMNDEGKFIGYIKPGLLGVYKPYDKGEYTKGNCSYAGNFHDGHFHGDGEFKCHHRESGFIYIYNGQFKMGKFDGSGTLSIFKEQFKGNWNDGKRI